MNWFAEKYKTNENIRLFINILFILTVSRFIMLVMMLMYNEVMGTERSISFLMNQWDAKRYHFIIENGYTFPLDTDPQANWAFFPLYVIVCYIVKVITFGVIDTYWVGMLVSNVCIFAAAFMAVKYMQLIRGGRAEKYLTIPLLMMAAPYSFYFGSVYTEALFVLFIVLFFYFCAKKRYILAGCMAAGASGTRIVGCMLVFALLAELFTDICSQKIYAKEFDNLSGSKKIISKIKIFAAEMFKSPKKIFAVMLTPLGAFAYMAFLYFFCGDVWAYKNVQIAWREDSYFPVIGVLWEACTGQMEPRYTYMGWFCIAVIAVYAYMFYKKHYSAALFGILSLLVALSSHVMSTCRFTAGSFVIYIGLYELLNKLSKPLRYGVLLVLGILELWLLFLWYNSDCWLM